MANSIVLPRVQFFGDNGRPLVGGRVHTYLSGTSTPAATYKDAAKAQPNANPIVLDGRGEAVVYLDAGTEYKVVLRDSKGALISTQDPVSGAVGPGPIADLLAEVRSFTESLAAPGGSSIVGFQQSGDDAVPMSSEEALRGTVTSRQYGLIGDSPEDQTEQVQKFIAEAKKRRKGEFVFLPGDYRVSERIDFSELNDQNDGTARNIQIAGYGARLVSTLSSGEAFRFDNVKDLTISGLQFATADDTVAYVNFDGCWYSTFNDCKFPRAKFGPLNLDTFESHYWNKFSRCQFAALDLHIGFLADRTEFHANAFYSCRVWSQGCPYAISVYGDASLNGVDFYNCDISYYESGMIYVDQVITSGQLNFHGGYLDGKNGGGSGANTLRNLNVNLFGFVNNPANERFDSGAVAEASAQVIEGVRGARNGSRAPTSAVNLIRNGDLRYGVAEISKASADLAVTEMPGMGLFGKYLNASITFGSRYLSFFSIPLPFDGYYTATVIFRNNGVTTPVAGIRRNGVELIAGAFAYEGTGWTVSTCRLERAESAGDIIEIRIGGANPSNFDVAYVGLTFGNIGLLAASGHPDAEPNGLTMRTSLQACDPASLADGAGETVLVTSQSASQRRPFLASFSLDLQGVLINAHYNAQTGTASNVAVRLQNETTGTIDLGAGTMRVMGLGNDRFRAQASVAYNPPSLADGSGVTTTVTVFGAALGDFVAATFDLPLQGVIVTAWVSAADTVSVRFQNETGTAVDLASSTLTAFVLNPCFDYVGSATYDPAAAGVNADGAGATTTMSVPGAALGDFATASFSQPLQGVMLSAYVSAANTVSVRYQNEAGATTTLASGSLRVGVIRSSIPPTV